MAYQNILLFATPGSGKGTLGKILGTISRFFIAPSAIFFARWTHARRYERFRDLQPLGDI